MKHELDHTYIYIHTHTSRMDLFTAQSDFCALFKDVFFFLRVFLGFLSRWFLFPHVFDCLIQPMDRTAGRLDLGIGEF